MPMHDFECPECGQVVEEIVKTGETLRCSACGALMQKVFQVAPKSFSTIVPDYPGAKKKKAGYVHTHADRNATKVQSGYGGCVNPK